MCLICEGNIESKWVISICRYLPFLSSFIGRTSIYCSRCFGLTSLPLFPQLQILYCIECSGLTSLPLFPQLKYLNCRGCRNLLILPEYPHLTYIEKSGCPWLDENNIIKLRNLQLFTRKNFHYFLFKHWIKSREGVEWIYHPERMGGWYSKKLIERILQK